MGQTIQQRQLKVIALADKAKAEYSRVLGERIHPRQYGFSPKFAALLGGVIGYDYGIRDSRGNNVSSLSITSDGFIISSSGAFLGDAAEFEANLAEFYKCIDPEDARIVGVIYARQTDYRPRKR